MRRVAMMLVFATSIAGVGPAGAQDASAILSGLADEYWEFHLKSSPISATSMGDRRYDHLMSDITPTGLDQERRALNDFLSRTEAVSTEGLSFDDRLTRSALITEIREQLARLDCELYHWTVDPLWGPQVFLFNVQSMQPIRTVEEGRAMVQRWQAMGPYIDDHIANLRYGLAHGKVAVRAQVEKTMETLQGHFDRPEEEWALLKPLEGDHGDWTPTERTEFEDGLRNAVSLSIRPALERYYKFLKTEVLPKARSGDKPGLVNIPDGLKCYRDQIIVHTSLALSPDEIHETGLKEVAKINQEMLALGSKLFGLDDRQQILEKLRTDPELYFTTREEVKEKAETALASAKAAIPNYFGILPKADCIVTPMAEYEEKVSTIAYYRDAAMDGSRPGQYYINTYAPETRPRYEAEALAFHEAIPGHHLQIAIAQELTDIPEFRKHTGVTAFVEGWALYTERLSNEMGLYTADLDRMGMLSYDAWRACRLVVDTGMHAKGWTRQQAIDFMLENTALAENNIINEVDRYITWPGQALAYKIGQLEIMRLRQHAQNELGNAFDIREFHDAVLQNGAVALEPLREAIEEYIQQNKTGASGKSKRNGEAG